MRNKRRAFWIVSLFTLLLARPVFAYDGDSFFALPIVGATFSQGAKLEIGPVSATYDGKFIEFRYHVKSKGEPVKTEISLDFPPITPDQLGSMKTFANRNKPNIFSVTATNWAAPLEIKTKRHILYNDVDISDRFEELGENWLSVFERAAPTLTEKDMQAFKDAGGQIDLKTAPTGWQVRFRSSTLMTIDSWTYIYVRYEPLRGAPVMDRLMQLGNGLTLDLDGDLDSLCIGRYDLRDLLFVASQLPGDDVILPYHVENIDFDFRNPTDPSASPYTDYHLFVKTKTGRDIVTTCEGKLERLSQQQYRWDPKRKGQAHLNRIWFIINEKK